MIDRIVNQKKKEENDPSSYCASLNRKRPQQKPPLDVEFFSSKSSL